MQRGQLNRLLSLMAIALAGCSASIGGSGGTGGGGDESATAPVPPPGFTFGMTEEVMFGLAVTIDGSPAPGVAIQIASHREAPVGDETFELDIVGDVYFVGATGAGGALIDSIILPDDVTVVDIIVHRAGKRGAYTSEALRTFLGAVAPSARIAVPRSALSNQNIALATVI